MVNKLFQTKQQQQKIIYDRNLYKY